ncbi:MAG: hypothetical protein IKT00_06850 [Prevotella sp.]|nr:hypothetical protein [Prevotella sp.]
MMKGIVATTCVFAGSVIHTNQVIDQDKVVTSDTIAFWQRDNQERWSTTSYESQHSIVFAYYR